MDKTGSRAVADVDPTKQAADGYQVVPVGGVPQTPSMSSKATRANGGSAAGTAHGGAPMSADGAFLD